MWPVASSVPTAKEEVHEVVPPLEVKEIQGLLVSPAYG